MMLGDFAQCAKSRGEKALVPFLTAGFPDEETFLQLLNAASQAGCSMIEVGIPFSDPIADGPVIQESSRQALENGMSLRKALILAKEASRANSVPLIFMSYFNPILQMGLSRFSRAARRAGVSGVIVPDVPFEESSEIRRVLAKSEIAFVNLIAPTSSRERVRKIAKTADGFLYLVSLTGVTGVRSALASNLGHFVQRVREETDLPLYVGFGISDRAQAAQAVRHADGVIIGSALIRIIQSSRDKDQAVGNVKDFLEDLKQAINGSSGSQE